MGRNASMEQRQVAGISAANDVSDAAAARSSAAEATSEAAAARDVNGYAGAAVSRQPRTSNIPMPLVRLYMRDRPTDRQPTK